MAQSLLRKEASECPGSDVRIPLQRARVRTSEPKGHQQLYDSSAALDLTFLRRTRGNGGRNVKSAALVGSQPVQEFACGSWVPFSLFSSARCRPAPRTTTQLHRPARRRSRPGRFTNSASPPPG